MAEYGRVGLASDYMRGQTEPQASVPPPVNEATVETVTTVKLKGTKISVGALQDILSNLDRSQTVDIDVFRGDQRDPSYATLRIK